jgi:hypothetical protein
MCVGNKYLIIVITFLGFHHFPPFHLIPPFFLYIGYIHKKVCIYINGKQGGGGGRWKTVE